MKKLMIGIGLVLCGLMILCTDYIIKRVIGAMPNVFLAEGVAVFSLSVIGWVLIGIGILVAIFGYREE